MSLSQSIELDEILEAFKGLRFTTKDLAYQLEHSFPNKLIAINKNSKKSINTYLGLFLSAKERQGKVTRYQEKSNLFWEVENIEAFTMANLGQKTTGLPMVIWVSEQGHTQHGPRMKVSKTHAEKIDIHNTVSVSLTTPPEVVAGMGLKNQPDFELIARYIELNRKARLDYWYSKIDTAQLLARLQKLKT